MNKAVEIEKPKLSKLSEILTFGKHKGKTLQFVLDKNPGYVNWLVNETNRTDFSDKVKTIIKKTYQTSEDAYYDAVMDDDLAVNYKK